MIQKLGAVFVNFQGIDVGTFSGSLVSHSLQPHPSIDPPAANAKCVSLPVPGTGFLGLLHMPGEGPEGATLYSDTTLSSSTFTR